MLSFLLGAAAGAAAVSYWRRELNRVTTQRMPDLRNRLADSVDDAERTIVDAVGRLSTRARTLLRAERPGPAERAG